MPDAQTRVPELTRAQKKVLADLELFSDGAPSVAVPYRKLVQSTGLSGGAVLSALDALVGLALIRIRRGTPRKASEYTLLYRGSVRIASGSIGPLAIRPSTGGAR
jgi:hypothetical protein